MPATTPKTIYFRLTASMMAAKVPARVGALASAANLRVTDVLRNLLMIGLRAAEKDPGALSSAGRERA